MEITEKEKEAFKKYARFYHVQINAMINYSPELIDELSDMYHLDFSKENIEDYIETLQNMYSAMYKYTKSHSHIGTVYRGTSSKEVSMLKKGGEYNQMLSTSNDYKVANTFAQRHYLDSPVRLDIDIGDATYIYMPEVLDNDIDSETINEDEILIAPFSTIESTKPSLSYGGVLDGKNLQSYNVRMSKSKNRDVPPLEDLDRDEITKNYSTLPDIAKEYFEIKGKINELDRYYTNKWDKTLTYEEYEKTKNEYTKRLDEIKSQIASINGSMQTYLKAAFVSIEQNIDKEMEKELNTPKEVSNDDLQRVNQSALYNISRINELLTSISGMKNSLHIDGIEDLESLGIDVSSTSKDANNLTLKLEKLEESLKKAKEDIESLNITEDTSFEDLEKYENILNSQSDIIHHTQASINYMSKIAIPDITREYVDDLKSKLEKKIIEEINKDEASLLQSQIDKNSKAYSNFFSIFTGKKKVASAMIRYCTAKMKNVQNRASFGSCNVIDSAKYYLQIHGDSSSFKDFFEKVDSLPDTLKTYTKSGAYQFSRLSESADVQTIEANAFAEETKASDNIATNNSFKSNLSSNVERRDINSDLSSLTSLISTMPKFSKGDKKPAQVIQDFSDYLAK